MTLQSLYSQRFNVQAPHPVGCEPIGEKQGVLHPLEDLPFLGLCEAERSVWLSPSFFGTIRWLHVQLRPIAPHFLINSSLYVILRLLSVHNRAPNGFTDILLGVHYINVMRELEKLKVRELP